MARTQIFRVNNIDLKALVKTDALVLCDRFEVEEQIILNVPNPWNIPIHQED